MKKRGARGESYIKSGRTRMQTKSGERYNITASELYDLMFLSKQGPEGVYDAIVNSFYMGVEAGYRFAKKEL